MTASPLLLAQRAPYMGYFTEGLAFYTMDGKWGFIDKTGDVAINPVYDYARDFKEGPAAITILPAL